METLMDILQQIVGIFHTILELLGQVINVCESLITPIINLIERLSALGITS